MDTDVWRDVCPNVDNISCYNTEERNLFLGPIPTYLSLVSSSLSCFGAASIIVTYLLFKELRTTTRSIITFLAVADLATASGYVIGGVNYLIHYNGEQCSRFQTICSIQSYVTIWSQLSSYMWNCFLALFLYIMIVYSKHKMSNCLITIFHVIAWTVPITIALPLLATGHLGYSPYGAANWCFVKDESYKLRKTLFVKEIIIGLVAGKIPEIFTFAFLIVFYTLTRCFIRQRLRNDSDSFLKDSIKRVDQRLLVIPLVFVLLRIWGTIQFFFTFTISYYWDSGCVSKSIYYVHYSLGIMEAIGSGGQGWANALIFVFLNGRTRDLILGKLINTLPFVSVVFRFCCRKPKYYYTLPSLSESSIKYGSSSNSTNLPQVTGDMTLDINY